MTTPMPPGLHPVDPDAEAARLIDERNRVHPDRWPVLCDETFYVKDGDGLRPVRIRVTSDEFRPVPADLGAQIAVLIRANFLPGEPS